MALEMCKTYTDLVHRIGWYLGSEVMPQFIRRIQEHGTAWCYYGSLLSDGRPVVRVLQAYKLQSNGYVLRDRTYTRDPDWNWVKTVLDPDEIFRTALELRNSLRPVPVPMYARPDVPSGE